MAEVVLSGNLSAALVMKWAIALAKLVGPFPSPNNNLSQDALSFHGIPD